MAIRENTISIIGAGISGIICALTLAKSKACKNSSIKVYEHKKRVGGRAHAVKVNDHFVDLGAGRFSSQLHHNVKEQVTSLNLPYEAFPFTQLKRPQALHKSLKSILKNLKPLCDEHPNDSFEEFLTIYVGRHQAKEMINALGYDSLSLPNISPHIAFDIIEKHPEIQGFSENAGYEWFNLKEGFSALTQRLYEEALSHGVEFHFGYELASIDAKGSNPSLKLVKEDDSELTISEGEMILTFPPTAMKKLDCGFPEDWSDYTYGSIPLFKGFLFYDTPWWQELDLADHVVITNNPIRKLYFKDSRYVFFYTDSDYADFWRDTTLRGEAHYLSTVKTLMAEALRCHESQLPDPLTHTYKHWTHGVEFSQECCPNHPMTLTHKKSHIISASDAYTPHCGWMEGGIMAGRSAANTLLKRLESEQFQRQRNEELAHV
ncbi:FAD-dependent oxidoreductase [Pseudoalteromonas luteoviolacea]|uniref:FAD-dependent oxidoreductase n=1 Tax=Pseudoalteromonas luteoviolacea TaxID=43657 RepID=UPI00115480E8|nr:FAD-dependent oxidoreductase [Pseudoalteromonas luteoviolacea]TQF71217.1 FAD-dependent oxidoreductase [Pseudoalteromonas luteoviolacea]